MSAKERNLSEISEDETLMRFSIDLVSAARRNLRFLRVVNDSQWLHHDSSIHEAIRRYDELWMPLIAELASGSKPPMIVPPIDIEWVWFCHTLDPASYGHYCKLRFSKLIGKAAIFDDENEEYALNRCREIWELKYSSEPFENEVDNSSKTKYLSALSEDLLNQISKQINLCRIFSEPYYLEIVYLIAAKQRYKGLLYMIQRFNKECSCLVPTSDVLLMWLTHKTYPTIYAIDVKELEVDLEKIVGTCEAMKDEYIKETKTLWETTFDQPYEKAGGAPIVRPIINERLFWDITDIDANTRYKSLAPRFLFEVCITVKLKSNLKLVKRDCSREFLRIRMVKRHRELKIDMPLSNFISESWQKVLHLYCEFGTKGMIFDLRNRGGHFLKRSTLQKTLSFHWNDLLRSPSLALGKELDRKLRSMVSVTPPVQVSYLLKCVPDRVTDDSGAMISDVILKMNQYRPQEGRWLSRTVLDYAGRECFVIRMRVGEGFWRRGGEVPKAVKWEDRIMEIREGSWSYVAGSCSVGRSPEKIVGTATPKNPPEGYQASWSLSTEHDLLIHWDSSESISSLRFDLKTQGSSEQMVRLLQGRQLQYKSADAEEEIKSTKEMKEEEEFVTLIRFSEENTSGKATALLNWKLLTMELLPEEDAVFVLLLCLLILRSISEMKREDIGGLLIRRRIREVKVGDRDWGSVILHSSSNSTAISSPYLQPWYWNPNVSMRSQVKDQVVSTPVLHYSQADGGDKLYKSGIIPP